MCLDFHPIDRLGAQADRYVRAQKAGSARFSICRFVSILTRSVFFVKDCCGDLSKYEPHER